MFSAVYPKRVSHEEVLEIHAAGSRRHTEKQEDHAVTRAEQQDLTQVWDMETLLHMVTYGPHL